MLGQLICCEKPISGPGSVIERKRRKESRSDPPVRIEEGRENRKRILFNLHRLIRQRLQLGLCMHPSGRNERRGLPSAGEKRRKKRPSRRQRLGIRAMIAAQPNIRHKMKTDGGKPKFKVGDRVLYLNSVTYLTEGAGMITAVIQPGIDGYSPNDGRFRYEIDTIYALNQSKTGWIMEDDIELDESPYKSAPYLDTYAKFARKVNCSAFPRSCVN